MLAKFMLLGNAANIGKRHKDKPLIWPTFHMSLMFLLLLLVLTTIEELLVGAIHGRTMSESLMMLSARRSTSASPPAWSCF